MKSAAPWLPGRIRHGLFVAMLVVSAAMACASVAGAPACDPATDPFCLGFTPEPAVPTWRLAWITDDGRAVLEVPEEEWNPLLDLTRRLNSGGGARLVIPPAPAPGMTWSDPLSRDYIRAARRTGVPMDGASITNPPEWRVVRVNGGERRQPMCSLAALFGYPIGEAVVLTCLRDRDEYSPFDHADGVWEETQMAFAFAGPRRYPVEFTRPGPRRDVAVKHADSAKPPIPADASLAGAVTAYLRTAAFTGTLPAAARQVSGWRLSSFQRQDIALRVADSVERQSLVLVQAEYAFDSLHADGSVSQSLLLRPKGDAFSVVGVWPLRFLDDPDRPMLPRDILFAVDLDDDGTDELVTSSAAWESSTFEVFQWTGSAVRRLYASPARGI